MVVTAISGYRDRVKLFEQISLSAAWYAARMAPERMRQMPSLASLLGEPGKRHSGARHPDAEWHEAKIWARRNGAKVSS